MPKKGFLYCRDVIADGYDRIIEIAGSNHFVGKTLIKEWSSEDYWKGSNRRAWTENVAHYVSLNLPIKKAPEYHDNDFDKWTNVQAFGASPGESNSAAAVQAAIDSGAEIVYFPYSASGYTVNSDVIVRGAVKKVDFCFNPLNGSGQIIVQSAGTVILENTHTTLHFVHDGTGVTVMRNGYGHTMRCGISAAGELYVDNHGPHAILRVGPGVSCWSRQLNREARPSSNDGGTLWLLGDNVERMFLKSRNASVMNPITTSSGGKTEILGGATDPTNHPHAVAQGAFYVAVDSYLSVVQAGVVRQDSATGEWGSYPYVIEDSWQGQVVSLYDESNDPTYAITISAGRSYRLIWPLYVSPQWSS